MRYILSIDRAWAAWRSTSSLVCRAICASRRASAASAAAARSTEDASLARSKTGEGGNIDAPTAANRALLEGGKLWVTHARTVHPHFPLFQHTHKWDGLHTNYYVFISFSVLYYYYHCALGRVQGIQCPEGDR